MVVGQKTLVVVEDDFIIQLFIKNIAISCGFNVIGEAGNSTQALKLVESERPDLILMDIGIDGGRDGIETVEEIYRTYTIPIIYITGNSDHVTLKRARETEPLDIIFKPISEDVLRSKLLEVIDL